MTPVNSNILSTPELRDAFFMALYKKAFPNVARYVARMGGSLDEAQDIFQDALVIYYEKVRSAKAEAIVSEQAYLLGIARMLWLQHYKQGSQNEPLQDHHPEALADPQVTPHKLLHYLESAGKKCMDLLKAFYFDGMKVTNIASTFGYSSVHSATVAKYKCLGKVRETIKEKSQTYADFVE